MKLQDLVDEINQILKTRKAGFAKFRQTRRECLGIPSNMDLKVRNDPSLARAGTTDELQFNIALGHGNNPNELRFGLALSFQGRYAANHPDPSYNKQRSRNPPVWSRLDQQASQFPQHNLVSLVWDPNLTPYKGFQPIGTPTAGFYFFGQLAVWPSSQKAMMSLAQKIVSYFDELMPIYRTVYCEDDYNKFANLKMNKFLDSLQSLLMQRRQLILQAPPGTGKTWMALRLCAKMLFPGKDFAAVDNLVRDPTEATGEESFSSKRHTTSSAQGGQWALVQFHPAYNYEDFVRGIQVSTDSKTKKVRYDTVHRVFSEMCRDAQTALKQNKDNPKKFVLIIDEINRANLAAVLGELIYALEYRGESVRTPYDVNKSGHNLTVPENLYVIGTMNTADRSVGHIDYAVRRRFAFVSMLPQANIVKEQQPAKIGDAAATLFQAVARLFITEAKEYNKTLSRDFFADDVQPGHTYFLAQDCDELLLKFVYQVLPLLREYVKDGVLIQNPTIKIGEDPHTVEIDLSKPILSGDDFFEKLRGVLNCLDEPATDATATAQEGKDQAAPEAGAEEKQTEVEQAQQETESTEDSRQTDGA